MKFNGNNLSIHPSAKIGQNVRIGDNTTIYANVEIGDHSVIANNCIIGEPLSSYYHDEEYEQPTTKIGSHSLIRSHAIIYASTVIGPNFSCGHRVTIREGSVIGKNCRVGTLTDIQGDCRIGDFVWLHSNVHVGTKSCIESFVLIYPYVILTNDPHPPSNNLRGVSIKEFAQIGARSLILPGLVIGEHSVVGAQALVSRDVAPFSCVVGNPAKHLKDVRELQLKDGSPAYPWPLRFERGMPWEGIGYSKWLESNSAC